MELGALVFYALAAVTIVASLGVVVTRSVVYSALLLVLALALTGLVYLVLLADFLALVQISVYGGTVSILLLFALMLTRPRESPVLTHSGWPLAAIGAVVLLAIIIGGALMTDWAVFPVFGAPAAQPLRVGIDQLGTNLFTLWFVPLLIAGVLLLVALVGALVIARATDVPGEEPLS